jgi:hypothetical protein
VARRNRTASYIDRVIFQNHLEKVKAVALAFGPYRFLGYTFLPDSIGIRLHYRLQALADRGVAGLRLTGQQHKPSSETNLRVSGEQVGKLQRRVAHSMVEQARHSVTEGLTQS